MAVKQRQIWDTVEVELIRRRWYATTASICILIFAAVVVVTGVVERRYAVAIDRTLTHEGRYFAELAGERFPDE